MKELARLKNLHSLNLSDTKVTDAGLKELAGLESLQALNLHETDVTGAGAEGTGRPEEPANAGPERSAR